MIDLAPARAHMQEHAVDAWLAYDFRGGNPVFWQLLGTGRRPTSRRSCLLIPAEGPPRLLVHAIDAHLFADLVPEAERFTTWQELQAWLRQALDGARRVAMEYSPQGAIPMHAWVDAGTVELVRAQGVEVVSSDDLFQVAAASWSEASLASHRAACRAVAEIKDAAFDLIRTRLRADAPVTELDVKQFILQRFDAAGLETDHGPIVAVGPHSGDPHYEPTAEHHAPIRRGDWVLIDLWAKYPAAHDVYSDITWVGYAGDEVPARHQEIFDIVTAARDRVVARAQEAWRRGEALHGWQLDMVAREYIDAAGYGAYFTHRTGHSMGPSPTPHALGVNLDNLETHDTRRVLPGVGFSVEPGIYLPAFGVRSEIDVYVDPEEGPVVTTPVQREVLRLV